MNQTSKNLITLGVLLLAIAVAKRGPLLAPAPVSPISEPGLHVLIVEESADRTAELAAVINSPRWQSLVPPGNWRILDLTDEHGRSVDTSRLEPKWIAALDHWRALSVSDGRTPGADANGSPALPWLIVSNAPHGGESKPLVAAELIPTVERWAQYSPAPRP